MAGGDDLGFEVCEEGFDRGDVDLFLLGMGVSMISSITVRFIQSRESISFGLTAATLSTIPTSPALAPQELRFCAPLAKKNASRFSRKLATMKSLIAPGEMVGGRPAVGMSPPATLITPAERGSFVRALIMERAEVKEVVAERRAIIDKGRVEKSILMIKDGAELRI